MAAPAQPSKNPPSQATRKLGGRTRGFAAMGFPSRVFSSPKADSNCGSQTSSNRRSAMSWEELLDQLEAVAFPP